jgi:hypothetical protein
VKLDGASAHSHDARPGNHQSPDSQLKCSPTSNMVQRLNRPTIHAKLWHMYTVRYVFKVFASLIHKILDPLFFTLQGHLSLT